MSDDPLTDTPFDCVVNGGDNAIRQCATEGVFNAGPSPTLIGLLIGATLLGSLYIAGNRDVVVPSVVTILAGSALVPMLPPQYVPLAYTVVVVGATAACMAAAKAYVLRGGY